MIPDPSDMNNSGPQVNESIELDQIELQDPNLDEPVEEAKVIEESTVQVKRKKKKKKDSTEWFHKLILCIAEKYKCLSY